ncbi:hypothetical protein ILYODFUR_012201 [Ilyodon furcidens]|uniref:Uncharacterized protein n=1 Tax=Ilyodon furcidens TaxID=33524 RepID=A0ABV0VDD6_9TELE
MESRLETFFLGCQPGLSPDIFIIPSKIPHKGKKSRDMLITRNIDGESPNNHNLIVHSKKQQESIIVRTIRINSVNSVPTKISQSNPSKKLIEEKKLHFVFFIHAQGSKTNTVLGGT